MPSIRTIRRPALLYPALLLSWAYASAQPLVPDTIPFTLTEQRSMLVPAILNDRDTLLLMFHSSFNGVSMTREGAAQCESMHMHGTGTAQGWGGAAETPVSQGNQIRIGNRRWDGVMVTIDEHSGHGSHGKFGYDLFADRVLEIDHDRKVLVVHAFTPTRPAGSIALPVEERNGSLFIDASVSLGGRPHTDQFMLHTGFGGTCILGTGFMGRLGEAVQLDTLAVKELSDSFGNVLKNISIRASSVGLGGQTFDEVPIQVMDPRSRFEASVLGGDLLRRFNLLLDLRGGQLYMEPNRSIKEAWAQ